MYERMNKFHVIATMLDRERLLEEKPTIDTFGIMLSFLNNKQS